MTRSRLSRSVPSALRIPHSALAGGALLALLAAAPLAAAELTVTLIDQQGQPVGNAVVSVTPLDAPLPPFAATAPVATVAQKGGEFSPYVTPVRTGTVVRFPNEDQVQHHVYSVSKAKPFEIPLYAGNEEHSEVFDKPGVVTVGCNIHDWMVAYVVVLDTPWFARSGEDGLIRLADLPAGRYRYEVWQPRLAKPLTEEIAFTADGPAAKRALTLTLKVDRRVRRALEGGSGGAYKP